MFLFLRILLMLIGFHMCFGEFCAGKAVALPPLVLQLLEVGALDASLQDGSVAVRSLAVDWGWAAVPAVRGMNARLPARARAAARGPAGLSMRACPHQSHSACCVYVGKDKFVFVFVYRLRHCRRPHEREYLQASPLPPTPRK